MEEKALIRAFLKHLVITVDSFNDGLRELLYEDEHPNIEVEEEELPVVKEMAIEINTISFDEVRNLLAAKAREGKSEKIKDLLAIFKAGKLSDVNEKNYQELYDMAKNI